MTQKTEFWLIRHGETAWNAKQKLQGWVNIPLNEVGRQQAQNLQRFFQLENICAQFDTVISSDLDRAIETATIALEHRQLPVLTDERLRERSYGIYEGQHWRGLMRPLQPNSDAQASATLQTQADNTGLAANEDSPTAAPNLRDPNQLVPEGESLFQFHQRITTALEDLAQQHVGQRVAIFAHGGVIDIVWRRTHDLDLTVQRPRPIPNTSINHFKILPAVAQWQPIRWEITDHLETQ